jgi:hypothetical protein
MLCMHVIGRINAKYGLHDVSLKIGLETRNWKLHVKSCKVETAVLSAA